MKQLLLLMTCVLFISCSNKDQKTMHTKEDVDTTVSSSSRDNYGLKSNIMGMQLNFYHVDPQGNREHTADRMYMFDSSGAIISISGSVGLSDKLIQSGKSVLFSDSKGDHKGFEYVLEYNYLEDYILKQRLVFANNHKWISYTFGPQISQDDDLFADDPVFKDTTMKVLEYTEFDSLGNWIKCGDQIERKIFYAE